MTCVVALCITGPPTYSSGGAPAAGALDLLAPPGFGEEARARSTASGPCGYRFFFSLIVSDCVCETGLPPRRGWKVNLAITGTPCPCLKAFLSAFRADAVGLTVKLTTPAAASLLPLAKTIRDG